MTLPAVILAAGQGERLARGAGMPPKPLIPVLGLTLLERAVLSCKTAGIGEIFVVLGHRSKEIAAHLDAWSRGYQVVIHPVENPSWQEGNGTSVLVCAPYISSPFLLLMCDHLVDPTVIPHLIAEGTDEAVCYLLVDRRLDCVLDRDDATRVFVEAGRITAIGKGLERYNGIDTGVFLCQPFLFGALKEARKKGDGTLSGGMCRLAEQGRLRAVELGNRFWLDVDTPEALTHARKALLRQAIKTDEDGYIARWLNRRFSIRITAGLLGRPATATLAPTTISLASFLIVLLGASLFTFKNYGVGVAAGMLIQLGSILDGCDGELARLTGRTSRFGAWFDTLLDRYGDVAVATGITFGFWRLHSSPWVFLGGMAAVTGFLLASYTKKEYALRYNKRLIMGIWGRLIKRDLRLFALFLGAVIGYPYAALIAVGLLAHVGIGRLIWQGRRTE